MPDNGNMVFIINEPPQFCPGCGAKIRGWDSLGRQDFFAHASFRCLGCGAMYQCVEAPVIREAALKAGGDLP